MSFVQPLLDWYKKNARNLPWRSLQTPYSTWVSEIMLQQTQVDTVIPYFNRWMAVFPDLASLSKADQQTVLSLWEGLGYYSRARNLLRAAKIVMAEWDGQLPSSQKALQKLPGIGPYTAAAIASIAFGADLAAVDGNIRRVLSRLFDVQEPARSSEGERKLWKLAQTNLPKSKAGDYNQALMDIGAVICTPAKPGCVRCPLADHCLALVLGVQEERPVKMPRKKVPHLTVTAAVIRRGNQVLVTKRPPNGLLGGLWEFPGGTLEATDSDLEACLTREIDEELGVEININHHLGIFKHAYTHFKITLYAFSCELTDNQKPRPLASDALAWVQLDRLSEYPMGKVDRQIAMRLIKEGSNGTLSA